MSRRRDTAHFICTTRTHPKTTERERERERQIVGAGKRGEGTHTRRGEEREIERERRWRGSKWCCCSTRGRRRVLRFTRMPLLQNYCSSRCECKCVRVLPLTCPPHTHPCGGARACAKPSPPPNPHTRVPQSGGGWVARLVERQIPTHRDATAALSPKKRKNIFIDSLISASLR